MPKLLSFIVDNRGKTVPLDDDGSHILIATNCVRNERLYPVYDKVRYLSQDTYDNWFRAHPVPGDVLFVCKGTPGRVCFVPDPIDFCIAQDMVALRTNPDILYNRFLLAVLRSRPIQEQITNTSVGDVIPHFKKQFFEQLLIPCPSMEIQKAIGDLYFNFCLKIEQNNKINRNLLQQLMLLYNNTISTSELNEVELKTICNFQEGYVNPAQTHPEYFDGEVKWLRAVDINESYIIETSRTLTQTGFLSAKKSALLFQPDTIAISKSGTIGRLGIIADYMCGNRAVINVAPKEISLLPFIYAYLKSRQNEFPSLAVGSVQKNLYVSVLESLIIQIPEKADLEAFCNAGNALLKTIKNNCKENIYLSNIRDTIMPQILSGELDFEDVNNLSEES